MPNRGPFNKLFCTLRPTFEKLFRGVERELCHAPNLNRAISMNDPLRPTFMKLTQECYISTFFDLILSVVIQPGFLLCNFRNLILMFSLCLTSFVIHLSCVLHYYLLYISTSVWCALQTLVEIVIFSVFNGKKQEICSKILQKNIYNNYHLHSFCNIESY